MTTWRSYFVYEAGKPSNKTTLTELNEARAQIAGGVRLNVSADKIRVELAPGRSRPEQLESLHLA